MIVVLADDFTGAAELAGVAFQLGYSVEVQTEFQPVKAEVVIVDMATRALSAEKAAHRARSFAQSLKDAGEHDVFVKIDSVLRGPIVPQLAAIAEELNKIQVQIVNANPINGRTVRDGKLYVDGVPITQTDFANDPEHPATSDNVLDLLGLDESNASVIWPGELWPEKQFVVSNNFERSHFYEWLAGNCDDHSVDAGGAEYFRAMIEKDDETRYVLELPTTKLERVCNTLIVVGSAIDWNKRKPRCEELGIPIIEFASNAPTFKQRVLNALQSVPTVMAAISCDRLGTERALKLRDDLVAEIQKIVANEQLSQLIIEGGGTATDLIQKCGWTHMSVDACHAQGVVSLFNQEAPGLHIVVKPGSYKWPDELF